MKARTYDHFFKRIDNYFFGTETVANGLIKWKQPYHFQVEHFSDPTESRLEEIMRNVYLEEGSLAADRAEIIEKEMQILVKLEKDKLSEITKESEVANRIAADILKRNPSLIDEIIFRHSNINMKTQRTASHWMAEDVVIVTLYENYKKTSNPSTLNSLTNLTLSRFPELTSEHIKAYVGKRIELETILERSIKDYIIQRLSMRWMHAAKGFNELYEGYKNTKSTAIIKKLWSNINLTHPLFADGIEDRGNKLIKSYMLNLHFAEVNHNPSKPKPYISPTTVYAKTKALIENASVQQQSALASRRHSFQATTPRDRDLKSEPSTSGVGSPVSHATLSKNMQPLLHIPQTLPMPTFANTIGYKRIFYPSRILPAFGDITVGPMANAICTGFNKCLGKYKNSVPGYCLKSLAGGGFIVSNIFIFSLGKSCEKTSSLLGKLGNRITQFCTTQTEVQPLNQHELGSQSLESPPHTPRPGSATLKFSSEDKSPAKKSRRLSPQLPGSQNSGNAMPQIQLPEARTNFLGVPAEVSSTKESKVTSINPRRVTFTSRQIQALPGVLEYSTDLKPNPQPQHGKLPKLPVKGHLRQRSNSVPSLFKLPVPKGEEDANKLNELTILRMIRIDKA